MSQYNQLNRIFNFSQKINFNVLLIQKNLSMISKMVQEDIIIKQDHTLTRILTLSYIFISAALI